MKTSPRILVSIFLAGTVVSIANAATTFTLNPLATFGPNGDGSINPGQSLGLSPVTALDVVISAPTISAAWNPGETAYDPRATGSTNGFNMRGLTWDAVSGNLIFCDTHTGSGGQSTNFPWSAIYILDANLGQIIGALNTNGVTGGSYTFVVPGVSDDGVVYVCNQTTASQNNAFKIYRWPTAKINDPSFSSAPVVAYSGFISNNIGTDSERLGQTMDVRGSGAGTQIIIGSSSLNGRGTNIFIFTTTDGTNFTPHRISFPGVITTPVFNDGIAFGPGNTFWAKQVGRPFLYMSYDAVALATGTNQITGTVISSFAASSVNDPMLNISAIAVDPVNHLLAGLEEIGGIALGGRGKVWLFDIADPTNRAPAILASRIYSPNFQKTLAPMGYVRFSTNGHLFAHASNNGFLVSSVDSVSLSVPTFTTDLPASTRVTEGQTAHFEVIAVVGVTNYQWYSNNVPIAGANLYFYNLPNASTNMSSPVFKVEAFNAAGSSTSANSTLTVVNPSSFFHPVLLWSVPGNTLALSNPTNFSTQNGGSGTPNERCIAYNALSNQLLVVRGVAHPNMKIMVVNADQGTNGYSYVLKTNGIGNQLNVNLAGIGVADDGAVYAVGVGADNRFAVYRWADTDPNTLPVTIFGTNSSAAQANAVADLTGSQFFRFGDNLAVRGAGNNTEIILDSQNSTKYVSILKPIPDGLMTNWTQTGYLLQNIFGSYGSEAYGTVIGRSLQFGSGNTFYQKRYNGAVGAPLAKMSYNPGGGLAPLVVANVSPSLYLHGPLAVHNTLGVAAAINFVPASAGVGNDSTTLQDTISFFDFTDPSQAVLLSTHPCPQGNNGFHKANGNAIGQVLFGANPQTGTNYLFVVNGNNGVAAFVLSGGANPPPQVLVHPRNLRLLESSSGSLSVTLDQVTTVQWYKGTNPPVYTGVSGIGYNFANATTGDAGDYFVIATNVYGAVTSHVAHVSVELTNNNYTLSANWSAAPGSFPYVTSTGGANTPRERAFAYNALSNQLIVVACPPASTLYNLYVVDGTSGANLYSLNTSGVVHEGASEDAGSNPIDLVGAAAGDDGSIYICDESPNASGGIAADPSKMLTVYRWTNSAPTTPPVIVFTNDPSGQPPGVNLRWGDVLAVRGTGMNTELILNTSQGSHAAVLKPVDASLNSFTNAWFSDSGGGGSIGRSIQFGPTNTVWEKRKGASLVLSSYDTVANTSGGVASLDFPTTLGGVAVDSAHKLVVGVDFVGATAGNDGVALYDITDPSSPMFIKRYNFAASFVANANFICHTIVSGNRVYSLDGNNGLMAFFIDPPANSMRLNITLAGSNVNLSWGNSQAILQGSPSLDPPSWTDLAGPGLTNSVQSATSTNVFYRLIQRL